MEAVSAVEHMDADDFDGDFGSDLIAQIGMIMDRDTTTTAAMLPEEDADISALIRESAASLGTNSVLLVDFTAVDEGNAPTVENLQVGGDKETIAYVQTQRLSHDRLSEIGDFVSNLHGNIPVIIESPEAYILGRAEWRLDVAIAYLDSFKALSKMRI